MIAFVRLNFRSASLRSVIATGIMLLALGSGAALAADEPEFADDYVPTVFITGANRGLGLGFTQQYLARGWNVIASCRTPEKAEVLQDLAKQSPSSITIELT